MGVWGGGASWPLRCSEDEELDVGPVFSHSSLVSVSPPARRLHALPRLSDTTSFVMCLSGSLPTPAHPSARLWRGAGLASVSITEAGRVTSAPSARSAPWVAPPTTNGGAGQTCQKNPLWFCTFSLLGHFLPLWPALSWTRSFLVCRCSSLGFRFGRLMELA